MLECVRGISGELLEGVQAYHDDANQYWEQINRFDKIERLQHFQEPGNQSWEAFASGRWVKAQEIRRRNCSTVAAEFAEDARRGIISRRIRVVEIPVTAYVQWELHGLKLRAEYGENIRVVDLNTIAHYEKNGIMPELIFMSSLVMYKICYDERGLLRGAEKFTDRDLISECQIDFNALYQQGEDLHAFFAREVEPLPPPMIDQEYIR
jgi:hypothetical protein